MSSSIDFKIKKSYDLAWQYKSLGFYCSEAIIRACPEALDIALPEGVIKAACGFKAGGGGYLDRCGVIEAGSMLISFIYGRLSPEQPDWEYGYLICLLHERFQEYFSSIYCRDILPEARKLTNIPPCIETYAEGAKIITKLLLEADELLSNAPDSARRDGVLWPEVKKNI